MAIHAIIVELEAQGIPATREHPDGTWSHTPEYIKRRYGAGGVKRQPTRVPKEQSTVASDKFLDAAKKMTPSERALLIAQLEDS